MLLVILVYAKNKSATCFKCTISTLIIQYFGPKRQRKTLQSQWIVNSKRFIYLPAVVQWFTDLPQPLFVVKAFQFSKPCVLSQIYQLLNIIYTTSFTSSLFSSFDHWQKPALHKQDMRNLSGVSFHFWWYCNIITKESAAVREPNAKRVERT